MDILKLIIKDDAAPEYIYTFFFLQSLIEKVSSDTSNSQLIELLLEALDNITIDMENVINVEQIDPSKKSNMKNYINKTKELDKLLRASFKGKKESVSEDLLKLFIYEFS